MFSPGNPLSQITGCHQLCRNYRQAQELSRFTDPTLNQFVAPDNVKRPRSCEEAVEDDTCLWKVEEN